MPPWVLAVWAKDGENPAGAINDFGKDFVTHWFSSVVNTPSMTPELPLIVKSPLLHVIRCLNLHNRKIHGFFSLVLSFLARSDKLS